MIESLSMSQPLAILITLSGIVAGSSVYFLRKSTDRMNEALDSSIKSMKDNNSKLHYAMDDNHKEIKKEVKDLYVHIDERIDKMYARLDNNSVELKEFIIAEVAQLKAKDYEQDTKIDQTKEKITSVSEDLLRYKIEAMERYEKKQN